MKNLILIATLVLSTSLLFAQDTWMVDASHSELKFKVSHMMISKVTGNFNTWDANITSKGDDFSGAVISFIADINSIDTDNENRDEHLKSADFFDAENHPQMTFKSTSFKKLSGDQYELKGNLSIRGVTKEVTLDVTHNGTIDNDGWGNKRAGFEISGTINRFDYGLKWNNLMEAGGAIVGEEVDIFGSLEIIQPLSSSKK